MSDQPSLPGAVAHHVPGAFAEVVPAARAALSAAAPEEGIATYRVESRQEVGLRSVVRIRQFQIPVDEPPTLAGADTAPSPVELVLAALASCQEITYRLYADALGIPLRGVAVTLEATLDPRGFFGVREGVRPGFQAIRGTVTLHSPAPAADLQRLRQTVDAHCPVLDLLANPTPVTLDLRIARSGAEVAA
jgi:putative redox protein